VHLLDRVDHAALLAPHDPQPVGAVGHGVAVVVAAVPQEAVLAVAHQLAIVHQPSHLRALGVDDRERHLGRLGEVEPDAGGVAHAVAVGGDVARLGAEAQHQRDLGLQRLSDEERGDRGEHEHCEDRADQGARLHRRENSRTDGFGIVPNP
jgi:hypothetical protein